MVGAAHPHYVVVKAPSPSEDSGARRYALFCHGILGSGSNWRTFARRFVERMPSWGVVLVDLREHGSSRGLPPPHTIEAAATDLRRLEATLDGPVEAILGHSFGGKVSLAWTALRIEAGQPPQETIVVDSAPGPRPSEVGNARSLPVIATLKTLPGRFPSRQNFLDTILAAGHDNVIAQWLAMNVERDGDQFRFGLDMDAVSALLDDYFVRDLWPVVEQQAPAARTHVTFVLGGRSTAIPPHERERMFAAAEQRPTAVCTHVIAEAGHWVHAEAPDALLDLVVNAISARPDVHTSPR